MTRKNGKPVSFLLDEELFEKLENYCGCTYLTKTAAIKKALNQMFEQEGFDGKSFVNNAITQEFLMELFEQAKL